MKNLSENARDLSNFRNKTINEMEKDIEETKETEETEELRLHRPEEELKKLIKDNENDNDLDNDNNINLKKKIF